MTRNFSSPAKELSFWIKGLNTDASSSLRVEGYNGTRWQVINIITNLPATGTTKTYTETSNPPLSQNFIRFRFVYTKSAGTLAFDDLSIKFNNTVPSFVPGYEDLFVKHNANPVNGLAPLTKYYYRVRAVTGVDTTGNSNVIAVTTSPIGLTSTDSSKLSTEKEDAFKVEVFPNPASDAFSINVQSRSSNNIEIIITDVNGKKVYEATGNNYNNYVIGKEISPGVYFIKVTQGQNSKTLKLVKER
jgi:hypothetical protein